MNKTYCRKLMQERRDAEEDDMSVCVSNEQCENCPDYESRYIEYPIQVNSIKCDERKQLMMGMYDTLNGEQVKCFPWYSFDVMSLAQAGFINGHGGSLAYYGDGSKIPYRSLAYNYSKNFIIFDFNPDGLTMDDNNNWVAHVIEDGLLKASVYKENAGDEFEEMLKRSCKNIGRTVAEILNSIQSLTSISMLLSLTN